MEWGRASPNTHQPCNGSLSIHASNRLSPAGRYSGVASAAGVAVATGAL
jgi:hypothetical protein